jgi:hypothetical protein
LNELWGCTDRRNVVEFDMLDRDTAQSHRNATPNDGQITDEVLTLGHALFDAIIERAEETQRPDAPFPTEEVRAAAEEFFASLRALLDLDVRSE